MELNVIKTKIAELRTSEATTKTLVSELAVAVIDRIHQHNDVDSANAFILALSPVNQKKMLEYMAAFSGHVESEGVLGKRKKERTIDGVAVDGYVKCKDAWEAHKLLGMNFWQWVVTKKPKVEVVADLDSVQKAAKKARKLAEEAIKAGAVTKFQAFTALTDGLFSVDDVLELLTQVQTVAAAADQAIDKAKQEPQEHHVPQT